jgi:hypothetical protein
MRIAAIALLLLLGGAALAPAQAADLHLLPASADYARNRDCRAVTILLPPSTHSAVDGNMISPEPVRMPLSQGDNAICFAYAAADMISQRVQLEISALDVATKYYFANPDRLAQSTNPELRRHLQQLGDYRAAIAESRAATEVSGDGNVGRLPYMDKLEGGEEDVAALLYNIDGLCGDDDLPSYDGYTHFAGYLELLRTRMRLFPPALYCRRSLGSAAPALWSPQTDAFNDAWLSRVERQCRRRLPPVPLLPVSYRVAKNEAAFLQLLEEGRNPTGAQVGRMFSMIDYALDHARAPAVGYSWYVLEAAAPDEIDLVADHSSIIVARRKVGATCQYRVQDNTGEYCARMRKGVAERCDYGRIWLTDDELKRTLYSVTYLR